MIVRHNTNEIFNNIVTITKMLQVIAFSCRCLWGVQETRCHEIYTTRHWKASLSQPLWSVRCAIRTFDVSQRSLRGSTFCFCLLRLGLAVTGDPAEHFGTRIHGVTYTYITQIYIMSTRPSNKATELLINRPLSLKSSRMRNRMAYTICRGVGGGRGVGVGGVGGGGRQLGCA